ncbi:sensor domain-containing diguanylate cyclase [Vreelandella massiliensis]|uniref:sensor domain-containing diguanylate cyclase n=1 Tax=Vreelandella massiliensis TaxID=1816686 RepID=UPI0009FA9F1B|nr:diguanylate cyclase [Halomonas massiliensis]
MNAPSQHNHHSDPTHKPTDAGFMSLRFEQFYIAVEQSPVATAITDAAGAIEFVNQRFLDITGYSRSELLGKTPALIQSGMTPNRVYDDMWTTLRAGEVWRGEILNRRKNGELYWEAQTITPVKSTDGEIINFVAVKEDITHRRQQENELRLMAAAFETGQATVITNGDMVIERVNQAFTDITGYESHEVVGQTPKLFKSGRHDKAFYQRMWQALHETGHWQGEIWNRNKWGDIYPLWQSITAVPDADGEVRHFVSVFHDIAERKRMEHELENQATRDHLTGAYNRRAFDTALSQCMSDAVHAHQPFVLLMFDIDHFKRVNDNYGHDRGDEILQQLAVCIKGCLRDSDILARWGGEEFAILLRNTQQAGGETFAQRIGQRVRSRLFSGHTITISIGVAQYSVGEAQDALVNRVDQALYAAKHQGRDTVVVSPQVSAENVEEDIG